MYPAFRGKTLDKPNFKEKFIRRSRFFNWKQKTRKLRITY